MKYAIQVLLKQVGGGYVEHMTIEPHKYQSIELLSAFRDAYEQGRCHDDAEACKVNIILMEGEENE